jgi:hypothetical protein
VHCYNISHEPAQKANPGGSIDPHEVCMLKEQVQEVQQKQQQQLINPAAACEKKTPPPHVLFDKDTDKSFREKHGADLLKF